MLCTLQAPIGDIGIAYVQLGKLDAERLDESYANDGQTVSLTVSVRAVDAPGLVDALINASGGRIQCDDR